MARLFQFFLPFLFLLPAAARTVEPRLLAELEFDETPLSLALDFLRQKSAELDTLVLSPKPPSSGENVDWDAFDSCRAIGAGARQQVMKIVIFDEIDYQWAREVHRHHSDLALYLQPGNPEVDPTTPVDLQTLANRLGWLTEKAMADGWFAPRILPQLHVLIWGNKRGV